MKDITEDEYKALKGFHKHIDFICDSPSDKDKKKLADAYRTCEYFYTHNHLLHVQLVHMETL